MRRSVTILGIESSCDETAAAIVIVRRQASARSVQFSFSVRSSVVSSQVRIHAKYGGVVPEVAAREHVTHVIPVIRTACARAGFKDHHAARSAIDAIAVTAGPGLITSLTVGVETARAIAFAWEKPIVAINHIEGHIISGLLPETRRNPTSEIRNPKLAFPALALVVSGGHTELLLMRDWATYERIGATRDDAAGEAFDKVARILGLGYPGGPIISKRATQGNPTAFAFPRGMAKSGDFDFSFSGLKTAVRYFIENHESRIMNQGFVNDICASFQQAVVDVLVAKTIAAAKKYDVRTILLGGGVTANHALREQLHAMSRDRLPHASCLMPHASYTGDNAAMIAAAGGIRFLLGDNTNWQDINVDANWELCTGSP